jgi:hypothetical protein
MPSVLSAVHRPTRASSILYMQGRIIRRLAIPRYYYGLCTLLFTRHAMEGGSDESTGTKHRETVACGWKEGGKAQRGRKGITTPGAERETRHPA